MSSSYQKFSGVCAVLAGAAGLIYLALFISLRDPTALPPSLALLTVGLFGAAAIVGLYQRVRENDEGFALLGLVFGIAGALGAAVHAAFDLANNLNPPAADFGYANPVDPRGFLTFAVAGLGAIAISWLILRGGSFQRPVGYLGIVSGVLLVLLYIAYLVILDATNPVVLVLVLASGILQPVWYLWIGWALLQMKTRAPVKKTAARRR